MLDAQKIQGEREEGGRAGRMTARMKARKEERRKGNMKKEKKKKERKKEVRETCETRNVMAGEPGAAVGGPLLR